MKVAFKVDNLNEMSAALASLAEQLRARQLCDDDVFASRLVSCELLTNVIRHSGEEAELVAELFSDRIRGWTALISIPRFRTCLPKAAAGCTL